MSEQGQNKYTNLICGVTETITCQWGAWFIYALINSSIYSFIKLIY